MLNEERLREIMFRLIILRNGNKRRSPDKKFFCRTLGSIVANSMRRDIDYLEIDGRKRNGHGEAYQKKREQI